MNEWGGGRFEEVGGEEIGSRSTKIEREDLI